MAHVDQPADIVSRLRRIEQRLDEVYRKVGISSATINRGTIRLLGDSRIEAVDAEDDLVFRLGALGFIYSNGRPQQGAEFRYENDQPAITVWNPTAATVADRQYTAIWNNNTIVMSTDASSGFGLGRPWLPISFEKSKVLDWPNTQAAAYENVVEAWTHQQHPWLEARITISGNPGTTGDARVMVAGNQVGDPLVFDGTNVLTEFRSARIFQAFGTLTQVTVEARRTAGAGSIYTKVDAWWRQT